MTARNLSSRRLYLPSSRRAAAMDAGLPTGLLERYPHHRATLQRLDALDQRIDDLERRAAVRRSQRGTPGFSAAARARGVLRVWCSHRVATRTSTQPSPASVFAFFF